MTCCMVIELRLETLWILQVASAQQTDAPAGPTPGVRPADGQANSSAAGQAGTEAGGEQAAVGAAGDRLAVHPSLPPAADAIPADATQNSAHPATQPGRKRSRKHRDIEESGTASCELPAMGAPSDSLGMSRACQSLCGCVVTWASFDPVGSYPTLAGSHLTSVGISMHLHYRHLCICGTLLPCACHNQRYLSRVGAAVG